MGEPPANAARSAAERYRQMARELWHRAGQFRSSEARQQLFELAIRYKLMAEHVDARSRFIPPKGLGIWPRES
jgi:hypothetical protein